MKAVISQKGFLGPSDLEGRSTIYWFDDGTPEVERWSYHDRYGQIAHIGKVNAFVDRLSSSQSLTIELSDYRYDPWRVTFRFDQRDTKDIADRFRKDCRDILDEHPKSLAVGE